MQLQLAIVDFDGTFTDAEREGETFVPPFLADVATFLGTDLAEIMRLAAHFAGQLDPLVDVWEWGGHVVAPATLDPYLRSTRIATLLAKHLRPDIPLKDVEEALSQFFRKNYPTEKSSIYFRPQAEKLVDWMLTHPAVVVTNSRTDAVGYKLSHIIGGGGLKRRVFGGAQKNVITDTVPHLAAGMTIPGLARQVLLRRGYYHQVIVDQMAAHGVTDPGNLLVIGDVFELDLALPLHLGAHVILLANPFTPEYEIEFVRLHPRGHVVASIPHLMTVLNEHYSG